MDKVIIDRWNEVVRPEDLVYHLGDIAFCGFERLKTLMQAWNGTKIVVKGNHDRSKMLVKLRDLGLIKECHRYLDFIDEDGTRILLHHVPIWTNIFHLCGHVHDEWKQQRKTINVGVDVNNFYPVALETIRQLLGEAHCDQVN